MIRALVTGFVQNWDVLCIQQLQQCKTPKAILTTYASSNLDETGENLHHTRFQILLENRTSRFSVKRQPSRTLVSFLHPRLHIAQDLYSWSSRLCRAGTKQGEHSMTRTRSRDGNSKSMWWICKIYNGRSDCVSSTVEIPCPNHRRCPSFVQTDLAMKIKMQLAWKWSWKWPMGTNCRICWGKKTDFMLGIYRSCMVTRLLRWILQHCQQFNKLFGILLDDNGSLLAWKLSCDRLCSRRPSMNDFQLQIIILFSRVQ